jgi:hypothetical protein
MNKGRKTAQILYTDCTWKMFKIVQYRIRPTRYEKTMICADIFRKYWKTVHGLKLDHKCNYWRKGVPSLRHAPYGTDESHELRQSGCWDLNRIKVRSITAALTYTGRRDVGHWEQVNSASLPSHVTGLLSEQLVHRRYNESPSLSQLNPGNMTGFSRYCLSAWSSSDLRRWIFMKFGSQKFYYKVFKSLFVYMACWKAEIKVLDLLLWFWINSGR